MLDLGKDFFGKAMLDTVCGADHVKPHGPEIRSITVAPHLTKLDAVVGCDCAVF